jgi:hypothetical protein
MSVILGASRRAVVVALLALAACCALAVAAPATAPAAPARSDSAARGDTVTGAAAAGTTVPSPLTTSTVPGQDGGPPIPRIIPLPNSGQAPQDPGDRGGWLQVSLFWFVLGALGVLALLIYRDGHRKKRKAAAARAARAE